MARSQRPAPSSRPRRPRTDGAGRAPGPRAADSATDPTHLGPVLEPEGRALLDALGDVSGQDPLALSSRLRAEGHPPERVAAVLTQAGLRAKGRARLGDDVDRLLLTRDGLEQATRPVVADLHAARLCSVGVRRVADLGCGLGLDARAFADRGLDVVAVERDAVVAAAAEVNLAGHRGARVVHGDAVAWARAHVPAEADAVWLDPARRQVGGGGSARVFDPEAFSPPLSVVTDIAATGVPVGVKLGPGLPHEAVPAGAEAEWVSVDGDVVEAALWFNAAARPGVRRAARVMTVRGGETTTAQLVSGADFGDSPEVEAVGEEGMAGLVGAVLHEPDGAVIRAGLVTDLAASWPVPTRQLDPHLAYLVASEPVRDGLARAHRIEAVHGFHLASLRRWAKETGVGRLDVKKRGIRETPEEVRRAVLGGAKPGRGAGDGRHATLVLARVGERRYALEVTPLD
ncbi:THUMP-like domain-containing protein [uncultured Micrococcus sp.]|uniref:THUMP-like domain-containing protein n=1 Tax=uncultured Micrococcus sp. TaxID=114051 RepID=UPI00260DA9E4|nr:SAM-dependent methyltransferase [uncultured Micrococcus sp.]